MKYKNKFIYVFDDNNMQKLFTNNQLINDSKKIIFDSHEAENNLAKLQKNIQIK